MPAVLRSVSDTRRRQRLYFSRLAPRPRARDGPHGDGDSTAAIFPISRSLLYGGISSSPGRSNPKTHNLRRGPHPPSCCLSLRGSGLCPGPPVAARVQAQSATWRPPAPQAGYPRASGVNGSRPGRRDGAEVPSYKSRGFVLSLLCLQGQAGTQ